MKRRITRSVVAVRGIVSTKTFQQSGVTFGGTFVNGLLGAVFYIFAARYLGPSSFGLLSVAIAFMTMMVGLANLGVDTGLTRFVGKYAQKFPSKAFKFLKLAFEIKFAVGTLTFFFIFLTSRLIAVYLFKKPELSVPLRITSFGVFIILLYNFSLSTIKTYQKFWVWSGLQILTNLLRLIIIIGLTIFGIFTVNSWLWVYILVVLAGFAVAMKYFLPNGFLSVKNEKSVLKEFLGYNKWVVLFTVIAVVSSRLDTFIAARFLSSADVGYYSAANQLAGVVPQIVTALGAVIAPKMAGMGRVSFIAYLKKTQLLVLGISIIGVLLLPLINYFIPYVYGTDYSQSVPIFSILLIAMLIFLISVPVHNAVFYFFSYPKLFYYVALMHLLVISIFGWFLTSAFGALGAAITVFIGQFLNFVVPAIWVFRRLQDTKVK